jgi:hypothetical protein
MEKDSLSALTLGEIIKLFDEGGIDQDRATKLVMANWVSKPLRLSVERVRFIFEMLAETKRCDDYRAAGGRRFMAAVELGRAIPQGKRGMDERRMG